MDANLALMKELVFGDLERELRVTRAVLDRLPPENYPWKPHVKSMSIGQLAVHVADMPEWIRGTFAADEMDAAEAPKQPKELAGRQDLLDRFDRAAAGALAAIEHFDVARMSHTWTMHAGGKVLVARPRSQVYRVWCMNHMIHHRGQLCVYLRLLNVPVPTVYFNSADDPAWVFD